jgi:hypothetical protein
MFAPLLSKIGHLQRAHAPGLLSAAVVRRGPLLQAMRHEQQRAAMRKGLTFSAALTLLCAVMWSQRGERRAPERAVEALRQAPTAARPE